MTSLRILYDGWPLCHAPNSPAALHLLALLAYLPETIQPILALPAPPPSWLPPHLQTHIEPTTPQAHLQWEQRTLPHLRTQLGADLLHLMTETASLLNGTHTVISPTQPGDYDISRGEPRLSLMGRLRGALAAGGTARSQAVIWPEDLPPRPGRDVLPLPPIIHPNFTSDAVPAALPHLPETYVLYHGPDDEASLRRTLEAWTWVAGPIGQDYPLVMIGLDPAARARVDEMVRAFNLGETVQCLDEVSPMDLPGVYRGAAVVFHPASVSVWGGAIRHGLGCGVPIVATETAWASAMVGPAAILVQAEDTRRLGASVIGIIVKEDLSTRLQEASEIRAKAWQNDQWGEKLAQVYARLV